MKPTDVSGWIGKKFGKLTVVSETRTPDKKVACVCYCDCDPEHKNPVIVRATDLKFGKKISCGNCKLPPRPYNGTLKIGDRSGRLTVTALPSSPTDRAEDGRFLCHCECECGTKDYVCKVSDIQTQNVKSCGCLEKERLKPINIGDEFGMLTVEKEVSRDPVSGRRRFLCRCKCNNTKIVLADDLNGGYTTSCGCAKYRLQEEYTGRLKVGDVFGKLTVVEIPKAHLPGTTRKALCTCSCNGELHLVNISNLLSGKVKSCGCIYDHTRDPRIHALKDKLRGMRKRCTKEYDTNFKHYGAKGIFVCDEWMRDSNAFVRWAIDNGYRLGDTIDRYPIKNGPYAPWNCRLTDNWLTQENNKTNNRMLEVAGRNLTFAQWHRYLCLKPGTLYRWATNHPDKVHERFEQLIREKKEQVRVFREDLEKFCEEFGY